MVWPAVIAGLGTLGGAWLGSRSSSQANKYATAAQLKAQQEQLAFMREQAAMEQQRWEEEQRVAQEQWNAMQALREPFLRGAYSVLAKYGISPPTMPTSGVAPDASPMASPTLGALMQTAPKPASPLALPGATPPMVGPRPLEFEDISTGRW